VDESDTERFLAYFNAHNLACPLLRGTGTLKVSACFVSLQATHFSDSYADLYLL